MSTLEFDPSCHRKQRQIEVKNAEIKDALGWVEDLRALQASQAEIAHATNYVALLRRDLEKLK